MVSFHAPAALPRGNSPRYPLDSKLCGPQNRHLCPVPGNEAQFLSRRARTSPLYRLSQFVYTFMFLFRQTHGGREHGVRFGSFGWARLRFVFLCVRKLNCISIKIILKEFILGTYLVENNAQLVSNSNPILMAKISLPHSTSDLTRTRRCTAVPSKTRNNFGKKKTNKERNDCFGRGTRLRNLRRKSVSKLYSFIRLKRLLLRWWHWCSCFLVVSYLTEQFSLLTWNEEGIRMLTRIKGIFEVYKTNRCEL
jgi:hypothetical protein